MNWLKRFGRRLTALFRKETLDREMGDELRFHLEMQAKENLAAGMSAEEADYAALRTFGGVDQVKEAARRQRTAAWLEDFLGDLRYGIHMLRQSPGFTAVAVLTLAIGIGANTAIFSCANAILFQPLPFPHSEQLVAITATNPRGEEGPASPGDFLEWRDQAQSFSNLAFLGIHGTPTLTGLDDPVPVALQLASANYFTTLGVDPVVGRNFRSDEDQRGKEGVVILSYGFWQREFGGRLDALNRTIQLDGRAVTIVGVMPKSFSYEVNEMGGVDLWEPTIISRENHGARYFPVVIGRLKAGVTIAQAQSEMTIVATRLAKQFPDNDKGFDARVRSLLEDYVGNLRPTLVALLVAVGFLLLICCVNLANLLLARALARQKEIVIRAALGAGRGRIVRQLLTESLLLAILGGSLGILLAEWGTRLAIRFAPPSPRLDEVVINGSALAFTCVLTLLTGLAFGLAPAFQATRINLNDALKAGARGSTNGSQKSRSLLVVSEIALALILLIGAGLFVRSLILLRQVDPGFQPRQAHVAVLVLPKKVYPTPAQQTAFVDKVTAKLAGLPGIQAVGACRNFPFFGANYVSFTVGGWAVTDPTKLPIAVSNTVTANYGRAMGIPLLRGRFFTEHDSSGAPTVALINAGMARRYFGQADPIGQRIGFMTGGSQPDHWDEIVGIVGNVKVDSLQDDETQPEIYEPFAQWPQRSMNFVIRTSGDVPALPAMIRATIASVDHNQPVAAIWSVADLVAYSFSSRNFTVFLFSIFSGAGLSLAAIGIYGVMAYFVTQRTSEIGIRMALGAQQSDVLALVFSQAARLVGLGLLAGLAGAFALTQFLHSLLFGINAHDPITFVVVAALLALVALAASLIPALRALRITPIVALRYE